MHQRAFLGAGWARGGTSEVVRRAHPASGAQWNVQVVRGKVNGKCLWNACKALSLGLLLMVLGAAMATIGYYADHLSIAQEVRGNHTVRIKNESRGFHLNNLSYAGPIVMGVGGFIVVAACVMTFEARDSAAKVVPARLKLNVNGPPSNSSYHGHPSAHGGHAPSHTGHTTTHSGGHHSGHGSLRTSGSQTGSTHHNSSTHSRNANPTTDRRAVTESFMNFSRGLAIKSHSTKNSLKVPQGSINKSPSAPDLSLENSKSSKEQLLSPVLSKYETEKSSTALSSRSPRTTFANCALLNAGGLLHRHALSVDETAASYRMSHESLQDNGGSQNSLAMDLHLECPITLRVHDRRRNPLTRQRRFEEEERHGYDEGGGGSRRNSHSCSPRIPLQNMKDFRSGSGGSAQQLPVFNPASSSSSQYPSSLSNRRRSSNASDITHRSSKAKRRGTDCCGSHSSRGRLERAISSDSRLTGAIPKIHHHHHNHRHHCSPTQVSIEQQEHHQHSTPPQSGGSSSDTDIRRSSAHNMVHFCTHIRH